jgi:short-subunit dehydrogenase
MRTMLLTGGGNGIGYWMVREWLENGNHAAVLDIDIQCLEALSEKYPDRLLTFHCDITDRAKIKEVVTEIYHRWARIDLLIHNACVCRFTSFQGKKTEELHQEFAVNYFGCVNLLQEVLPNMTAAGQGKVFVTSSGIGLTGFVNISGYASTKGALESLVKCLKLEYMGKGIEFHILHPPLTQTQSSDPLPIPREFKAEARKVGRGFIKRIDQRSYYIGPTAFDALSAKMSYYFPLAMGRLLTKLSAKAQKHDHTKNIQP